MGEIKQKQLEELRKRNTEEGRQEAKEEVEKNRTDLKSAEKILADTIVASRQCAQRLEELKDQFKDKPVTKEIESLQDAFDELIREIHRQEYEINKLKRKLEELKVATSELTKEERDELIKLESSNASNKAFLYVCDAIFTRGPIEQQNEKNLRRTLEEMQKILGILNNITALKESDVEDNFFNFFEEIQKLRPEDAEELRDVLEQKIAQAERLLANAK